MNAKLKWLAICAFIGSAISTIGAGSQDYLYFEQDLVACQKPEEPNYTPEFSERESIWHVKTAHGTLLISTTPGEYVQTMYSRSDLIVSDDRGEFGGNLCCIPYRGDPYVISNVNVNQLIEWDKRIYLLKYRPMFETGVFSLLEGGGPQQKYVIKEISSIEGHPVMMAVVTNDTALLVTSKGLFRVNQKGQMTMLYKGGDYWQGKHPRSAVVLADKVIVVSMQKYIVRLKLDAACTKVEKEEWFEVKRKKEGQK